MPLITGKSPSSFSKNISTEMHEGKPLRQSLAIAYSLKRKAQKEHRAKGGEMCAHGKMMCHMCHGGEYAKGGAAHKQDRDDDERYAYSDRPYLEKGVHNKGSSDHPGESVAGDFARQGKMRTAKSIHMSKLEEIKSMKKPELYAEGGESKGVHEPISGGRSNAGNYARIGHLAKSQPDHERYEGKDPDEISSYQYGQSKELHRKKLEELKSMKKPHPYSEGGFVDEEESSGYEPMPEEHESHEYHHAEENQGFPEHEEDMVGRIMKKRSMHMSEGGRVANASTDHPDAMPAEYDDLVKDDGLEEHYTGENSGDEIGDEAEDEDRHDIVSRIMKSRRLKDRNPRPA